VGSVLRGELVCSEGFRGIESNRSLVAGNWVEHSVSVLGSIRLIIEELSNV
jgi:hypothetical protein